MQADKQPAPAGTEKEASVSCLGDDKKGSPQCTILCLGDHRLTFLRQHLRTPTTPAHVPTKHLFRHHFQTIGGISSDRPPRGCAEHSRNILFAVSLPDKTIAYLFTLQSTLPTEVATVSPLAPCTRLGSSAKSSCKHTQWRRQLVVRLTKASDRMVSC
jgi:hypothetical protein